MAKASLPDLRKAENWRELGLVVKRTWRLSGLSLKEFADAVDRDQRQIARWCSAAERPQIETLLASVPLRKWVVIALAVGANEDVDVEAVIRIRRIA